MFADLVTRMALLVRLEAGASSYPRSIRRSAITSLPTRWISVTRGTGHTPWGAHELHYETRFEPILMHVHQRLAIAVVDAIQSTSQQPIRSVLDIGANVGQFAVSMLTIDPQLRVVSFEPNPSIFPILAANRAQFSAWEVVNAGVSDHSGSAHLHYLPGRSGQGSLEAPNAARSVWRAQDSEVRATQITLVHGDWIATNHSTEWDLIKIDVEGHERSVLAGLTNLQWRYLLIEVSPGRGGIDDEADLERLLAEQGVGIEALTVVESSATGKDVLVRRRA